MILGRDANKLPLHLHLAQTVKKYMYHELSKTNGIGSVTFAFRCVSLMCFISSDIQLTGSNCICVLNRTSYLLHIL